MNKGKRIGKWTYTKEEEEVYMNTIKIAREEHEFCLRCGRKLKSPLARKKGYGPTCEKKMKTNLVRKLF